MGNYSPLQGSNTLLNQFKSTSLFKISLHRLNIFLSLVFSLLLNAPNSLALEPFNHEYKSKFAGFNAKSFRTLTEVEEGIWELRMVSKNFIAKYEEVSRFKLDENGYPIPIENYFEGRLFGVKRKEMTRFDWDTGTATWNRKEDVRSAELEPGMVDRILYQILVPVDAQKGTEIASYSFINRGAVKTYDFERLGTEIINLDGSDIEAVKMRRIDDKKEKETTLWLAPEMNYELVKIHHHDDDGADYELELKIRN